MLLLPEASASEKNVKATSQVNGDNCLLQTVSKLCFFMKEGIQTITSKLMTFLSILGWIIFLLCHSLVILFFIYFFDLLSYLFCNLKTY